MTDPVNEYGHTVHGKSQFYYDKLAFANRWGGERGVPDRVALFRRIADRLLPGWFEWHSWTDKVVDTLSHEQYSGYAGCSGSCKTFNLTSFGVLWWLMDPPNSSLILCSTTMKSLRKRAWPIVTKIHSELGGDVGHMLNSQTMWMNTKGDDAHAIFAIAVQEGDINRVAANIQGIHTKRQMVIIDEAPAVQQAIWTACANLYSYPADNGGEFILAAVGNPRSRIDQFGRFIEPAGGYDTVSVDTQEWEGKEQLGGKRTKVVRFDFLRSPRVTDNDKVSKHLPSKRRVESRMKSLEARGAQNDPDHWCYDRGFPPPEGLSKTVFTESLLVKHDAFGRHEFTGSNFRVIGFFDQARTGDRPCLRPAVMGDIKGGMTGIEQCEPVILYPDAASKDPIAYQLFRKLRAACRSVQYRGQTVEITPDNLGIDIGNEAAFADICDQEWKPEPGEIPQRVIRVNFGGGASEDAVSLEDPRPGNTVWKNKRSEMYFRTRNATTSGQFKGIDRDTATELCQLEYSDLNDLGISKPIVIQDKKEYKLKFGNSPDLSDSSVGTTEVARLKGFRIVAIGQTVFHVQAFEKIVEESQEVYHDIDYRPQWDEDEENAGAFESL